MPMNTNTSEVYGRGMPCNVFRSRSGYSVRAAFLDGQRQYFVGERGCVMRHLKTEARRIVDTSFRAAILGQPDPHHDRREVTWDDLAAARLAA